MGVSGYIGGDRLEDNHLHMHTDHSPSDKSCSSRSVITYPDAEPEALHAVISSMHENTAPELICMCYRHKECLLKTLEGLLLPLPHIVTCATEPAMSLLRADWHGLLPRAKGFAWPVEGAPLSGVLREVSPRRSLSR